MYLILIVLFNLIIYAQTINCGLIVDDIRWSKTMKERPFKKAKFKEMSLFKKMKRLIYFGLTRLYGANTFGSNLKIDHAFSIFLHIVACLLIYIVFGKNNISFWAAMLYSCHPASSKTAVWLNGRRYSIVIILILSMMLYKPFGVLLYLIALKFQLTSFFGIMLYGWPWLAITPLILFIKRKQIKVKVHSRMKDIYTDDMKKFTPKRIIVIIKTFGCYFTRMIFPTQTFMVYPELYYWGITKEGNKDAYSFNWMLVKGIICLIVATLGILYFKDNLLLYWVFMILAILQWCNIVPATQSLADRYVSLANVFMMFFISVIAYKYLGFYAEFFLIGLTVYYVTRLQIAFLMYPDITAFYDYHNYFQPENVHCANYKAHWYIATGRALEVFHLLINAHRRNPTDFKTLMKLSECCLAMGDFGGAKYYLLEAEKNIYVNQEKIAHVKIERQKKIIVVDEEMEMIRQKRSDLSAEQRSKVERMYNKIHNIQAEVKDNENITKGVVK